MKGTMKQALLMGKGGPWEVREVPIPTPQPGQLLIKMRASSICNQTDLNTIKAKHPPHDHQNLGMLPHHFRMWDHIPNDPLADAYPSAPYPREPFPTTMGHEGMGVVVEVGPRAQKEWSLLDRKPRINVGDRVAMLGTIGAYGEYVVAPEDECVLVPDNLTDEEASLFEPICLVNNIVRQTVEQNEVVCVTGAGALGLIAINLAKIYGAKQVIASEPIAFKRDLALQMGADIVIDPTRQTLAREIEKITHGVGVDTIIECAGVPETIRCIPYIAKCGCKVGCIGACTEPVLMDWSYIHFRGMNVTSQTAGWMLYSSMENVMQRGINMMASGRMQIKPLITHHFRLTVDDLNRAFELVERGEIVKGMFLFDD